MIFHGLEAGKRNQAVQTVLNVYPINRNMECNRKLVGWMDGWMDGWMEGWRDGWREGFREGEREEGWMDEWEDGMGWDGMGRDGIDVWMECR